MTVLQKITPCLWFDSEAEEAARFYVAIFGNARIGRISRYGEEGFEIHGRPEGSVMTVEFEIAGQGFTALNDGPHFKFNEAISFKIPCETQKEIDHYWERLSAGGEIQQCGWLKEASPGKYSRRPCRRCCAIPTRRKRRGRCAPCSA
jgi:predicted 3-demethylubiquinone-9 3-methyltransferase (glyoxalase superfamily)